MFRGYFPALTLLVFGVGIGIGLSWSRGFIPLTVTPANSGTLSVEVAQREDLPPPNDSSMEPSRSNESSLTNATSEDLEIFEQQSEPAIDKQNSTAKTASYESNRTRTIRPTRNVESSSASDESNQSNAIGDQVPASAPIRTRNRNAIHLDSEAEIEEAPVAPRGRRVTATVHQDPNDSTNDAQQSNRNTNDSSLSPREQLAAAEEKLAAGDTLAAHRDLSKLYWNHKELRPQLQDTIDSTAKAIFFQSKPHYIEPYVIQESDRLEAIAKKYQLSWEYLSKLNQTEPRRIQIGQKLKVVKGPFSAVVDLQEFALTVHLQGYYVRRYNVGIGQDGSSPIGKFPVLNKVENPQYTDSNGKVLDGDDPSNPLGERWIDLGGSYGIHGTVDPNSIGKAKSRGCIRLRDNDIIEVYNFLVKGSEVVIRK